LFLAKEGGKGECVSAGSKGILEKKGMEDSIGNCGDMGKRTENRRGMWCRILNRRGFWTGVVRVLKNVKMHSCRKALFNDRGELREEYSLMVGKQGRKKKYKKNGKVEV